MAQSHQQDLQRNQSGLQQISARIQARTMLAKKRVENIKKNDVKGFFIRNAFVILTIAAVIIGKNIYYIYFCITITPFEVTFSLLSKLRKWKKQKKLWLN